MPLYIKNLITILGGKIMSININDIIINGDIFIIPNAATKIHDHFESSRERLLGTMTEICDLNNTVFNDRTDRLVQCWYCSKELGCDNIPDHSIYTTDENGQDCRICVDGRFLPSNLFEGKKEGDVISIKIPLKVYMGTRKDLVLKGSQPTKTTGTFNLRLAQKDYRYRSHGSFEEVFTRVMSY